MSIADTLKGLIFKKPANSAEPRDPRRSKEPLAGGRRAGEAENPYLAARRTWNDHVGSVVSQRQTWQVIGILSLLIALAGVGGVIHIGSQSKFIPYVVEVDKLGQTVAAGPVQAAGKADPRVIHAAVADWMSCARMVSPDVALPAQVRVQGVLDARPQRSGDAKDERVVERHADSSPFKRAEKEMVSVEIKTVIRKRPTPGKSSGWETTRDRQAR
uniref:Conjugal transfer protein TrbF n=1 Tax=Sym plasmid TaxID=28430 RepID=A0A515HHY3_9ZZZZ|nr:conjugal transfer protein TrbF [Sym plasmid]